MLNNAEERKKGGFGTCLEPLRSSLSYRQSVSKYTIGAAQLFWKAQPMTNSFLKLSGIPTAFMTQNPIIAQSKMLHYREKETAHTKRKEQPDGFFG